MYKPSLILITLALLSLSAPALAVYKCEAAGKTVYSDVPCPDSVHSGKELRLTTGASDSADAQRRQQQDKKELQRLESARKKQEAVDQKEQQRARKAQQARAKKCNALALRIKWAKEDADRATGRSREKAERNLRRAEEKHQLSCDARS